MSIETWKAEFYPVEADKVPEELAVEHSLRKWRGLTKENLARHELTVDEGTLFDSDDEFEVDADSCSLCSVHLESTCGTCPLCEHLGKPCYGDDESYKSSPFGIFMGKNDPLPMIAALEAVAAKTPAIKAMKRPTKSQIDMMRHALGADGRAPGYRNHYAAEPDDAEINVLVELGLMRRGYDIPGGLRYFHVTEAGQEMVGIKEQ